MRYAYSLKDFFDEEPSQKHLDKLISVQQVIDTFYGSEPKEMLVYFLEDGRNFKLSDVDLFKKSLSMFYTCLMGRMKLLTGWMA